MTPEQQRAQVESYIKRGFKLVFWPGGNGWKGPRDKQWLEKGTNGTYKLEDYTPGDGVGIMHGVEVQPGHYAVDVDIDWGPGFEIAVAMLPATGMVWGRPGKRVSHCFYLAPDTAGMYAYKDVGKEGITLIEFRSDKHQSMAPPSIWEKEGKKEQLAFVSDGLPALVESSAKLKHRTCLAAIGMLLAKHLGKNGFGHEPRLAWAGFLLRAGISIEDLVVMGNAISRVCNNTEVADVRRVIESTATALAADGKKVKGGPALAKIIGDTGKAVINRINEWIGRDADFIRRDGKIVAKSEANIRRAIEMLEHELSYDDFLAAPMLDGKKMEDREVISLLFEIEREFHFQPPNEYYENVVRMMAWENPYHPVKDYLNELKWDGTKRIDTWLIESAGVEDSPYTRAVSAIMLIAGVRRIRQPGCKYDEMVIWESEKQGLEKSSAAQALCPNPNWFADDLPLNARSQQLIEATLGKWIVEASDLAGKRKAEIEHLKATLSRQVDGPARMAYARLPIERPRHFILIGTTNSSAYFTDPTGARRFWPLKIGKRFDVAWIRQHRDQLWAEACVREAAGESIRLPEELWPAAGAEQEKRREVDPWETLIRETLLNVAPHGDGRRRVTAEAIWNVLGIMPDRRDRTAALRISDIMQRFGFRRTAVREDGKLPQQGFIEEERRIDDEVQEEHSIAATQRVPGEDDVPF